MTNGRPFPSLSILASAFALFHREKVAENYGQLIRLSSDERQLLTDVEILLRETFEARRAGGKSSTGGGRPRNDNPSASALYQRERRARKTGETKTRA